MQLIDLERKVKLILRKNLKASQFKEINSKLTFFVIKDENLGDYSTNLIFLLNKFAPEKKEKILEVINKKFKNHFSKIEVVNDYLNFYLSDYVLLKTLRNLLKKKEKGLFQYFGRKRKVIVEYVSANPTGPLHLGNIRGAVLGDVLANIFKILGFRVTREYYVNDRGTQVELLAKSILARLGKINFEENFYQGEYLSKVAEVLKDKIDKEENLKRIGKIAADYLLENYIKPALQRLRTTFDNYFYETELYRKPERLEKILKIYRSHNLIEEKDGALILKLSLLGEPKDEYLTKQNGEPTYFLSDILYHYNKFFERKFKIGVGIVGADHHDHIRRLKKALEILKVKESQIKIITYQHVLLKKGDELLKMAKRKGTFVTIDDLLALIDYGVVRTMFLSLTPDKTLGFDLELAQKKSEENPYWYFEYAHARLHNILSKAQELGLKIPEKIDPHKSGVYLIKDEQIKLLVRKLHKFKDISLIIYRELKPNLLYDYLMELTKLIHSFYEKKRIIQENQADRRELYFVKTLKDLYAFLLKIMNVEAVERI